MLAAPKKTDFTVNDLLTGDQNNTFGNKLGFVSNYMIYTIRYAVEKK